MFDFPLTQEQLADATGPTPVHTDRTLQSLRKDDLIQLSARSRTVLDWQGLSEVADFDELPGPVAQPRSERRASGSIRPSTRSCNP
jgi:hypothetical protein